MFYDPRTEPHGLAHTPINALVCPRPIGWITTLTKAGTVNLAPYSFFNLVSGYPPVVIFSSGPRKDSQTNAEETGEFVYNMATWELREVMNASSAEFDQAVSEPDMLGLEMIASHKVKPPRVKRSPVHFECRYMKTVELIGSDGSKNRSSIVIGEVVGIHIDDSLITDGMVDITRARPIARLGYMDYCVVDEAFEIRRPVSPEGAIAAAKAARGRNGSRR
jgi:flavin reductase (DIM6/NTAB) family NADH-FMN oxidoreductase RutF